MQSPQARKFGENNYSFSIPFWFALRYHFFVEKMMSYLILRNERLCRFLTKKDQKCLWCQSDFLIILDGSWQATPSITKIYIPEYIPKLSITALTIVALLTLSKMTNWRPKDKSSTIVAIKTTLAVARFGPLSSRSDLEHSRIVVGKDASSLYSLTS